MNWWIRYKKHVLEVVLNNRQDDPEKLSYLRNAVFCNILTCLTPLSLIALIPSVYMAFMNGAPIVGFADLVTFFGFFVITVSPGIKLETRKSIFIFILYCLSLTLLYYLPLPAPGLLFLLAVTIFSSLIYSSTAAYYSAVTNTLICVCFALLICFRKDIPISNTYSLGSWIAISSHLVLLSFVCSRCLDLLLAGLTTSLNNHKAAEIKLIKSNRLHAYISAINQMIVKTKDQTSLFNEACRIAVDIGKYKMAWIGTIDEATKSIIPLVHAGEEGGYLAKIKTISMDDVPQGRGPTGSALRDGKYIVYNDIENNLQMAPWKEDAAYMGYLSSMALPIKVFGKVVGAYSLYAPIKDFFDDMEIAMAEEAVRDISFAIENFEKEKRHKQAEEIIFKNEKRFRALIEQSADMETLATIDGKLFYASPSVSKVLGYALDEFLITPATDIIHPDDIAGVFENVQKISQIEGGSFNSQYRLKHKNGNYIWCEGTMTNLLHEPYVKAIVSNFRDVSERKKLELLLIEASAIARIGAWNADLISGTIFWSDMTKEIHEADYNYIPDLATGLNFYKEGKMRDVMTLRVKEAIEDGRSWDEEMQIITVKKNERWIRTIGNTEFINGKCLRIYGSFQDIDQRKKAEEEIKIMTKRLQLATDNAGMGIWDWDIVNNNLVWDEGMYRLFEIDEKQLGSVYNGWVSRLHLEDIERVNEVMQQALSNKGEYNLEFRVVWKDLSVHYIKASAIIERDKDGNAVRMIGVNWDITELKEKEHKLIVTSNELQHALNDLTNIMDSSLDVICAVDAKGNFLKVSAASEAVWGYKPEELNGKPLIDFVYHEDSEKTLLTADNVMRGNKLNHFENRYVRKDGSLVPIEWSARWDEKDQIRYGIARDVTEKKRLQKAFEIERQQFYDLFSEAPSCMGILSGPDHRFEMANPLYLQLIGKKDIIGKSVKEVLPEIAVQGFIEILDRVNQTGKTFSANEMIIKLDVNNTGKPVDKYLNFIYQPYIGRDGKPDGILFFAVDVTEQVMSRKKIEESEKEVRAIAESMPQIVWVTTADGKNSYFNHQWVDYTGLTLEESLGDGWLLPFHEQDKPLAWEAWNNAVKTLSEYSVECRLQKHDGSYRWWLVRGVPKINENGKIVKWYGTYTDIEKIKEKEKQLTKSELFNRSVINSITDHIAVVDEQGIITTVNNAWEQFALKNGETRMERIGKGANYFHACEKATAAGDTIAEAVLLGMKDVLNEKKTIFYLEYPCHSPKEERWFGVRVMKFEGKEKLIITLHIDITDRKKEEKEKEKITLDLVQRNKNLEQFSYIVSHNLRAPVANILGFAELMKYENGNPELILDSMKGMSIAAQNLDSVVKDMMTILQVRSIVSENKEEIRFQNLIEDISLSIDNIIKKENVIIQTDFKSIDKMLSVKSYLYSIFYNLIINSIKFHKLGVRPLIEIQSLQTPTGIQLIFKDNGIGIDLEKHKESLFGLYKRFHAHVEGKGMGMFMIKTQVEAIGGKISVISEVNNGTEFTIEFENIN